MGIKHVILREFNYIHLYWEWTEHLLSYFGQRLGAVYYIKQCMLRFTPIVVMFIFFTVSVRVGGLPPTLFMLFLETSIYLWHLHRLGGLPIKGRIYDGTITSVKDFNHNDKQNQRVIPSLCKFLCATFRGLEKAHSGENGVSAKVWIDF